MYSNGKNYLKHSYFYFDILICFCLDNRKGNQRPTWIQYYCFYLYFVMHLTVATAPTSRPQNPGDFDLNQEMDIFEVLLQK